MNFLDKFTNTHTYKTKSDTSSSYHVFIKMLNYYKEQISVSEYMTLYFFHNTSEKCLSFLRRKDLNTGVIFYNDLIRIDRTTFPAYLSAGVEANFYACDAYFDYVEHRYDESIEKLQSAIKYTIQQSYSMDEFASSLYELNLNLLRVYIKEKSFEKTALKLSEILSSLFFSENNGSHFDKKLNNLDDDERLIWLNHVINNVIFSISELNPFGLEVQKQIYINALKGIGISTRSPNSDKLKNVYSKLKTIFYYLIGEDAIFLDRIDKDFSSLGTVPFYVRKQILSYFLALSTTTNQENIVNHVNYLNFSSILKEHNLQVYEMELSN